MICQCDDCGFIGVSEGLNSGGWAIIHKYIRDNGGRVIDEIWKTICPACVEKHQNKPKENKQIFAYKKARFEEPED